MTKWLLWKGQGDVEKDHLVQSELRDVQLWNWLWNAKRPSLLRGPSQHWDLHQQTTLIVFSPYLWESVRRKKLSNDEGLLFFCVFLIMTCIRDKVKHCGFQQQSFPVYIFHLGALDKNNSVHMPQLQMVKQPFQTIRWRYTECHFVLALATHQNPKSETNKGERRERDTHTRLCWWKTKQHVRLSGDNYEHHGWPVLKVKDGQPFIK